MKQSGFFTFVHGSNKYVYFSSNVFMTSLEGNVNPPPSHPTSASEDGLLCESCLVKTENVL